MTKKEKRNKLAFLCYVDEYYGLDEAGIKEARNSWNKLVKRATEDHMGDCTNEPNRCMRCLLEESQEKANFILERI